jgi:HEAT repeat protein
MTTRGRGRGKITHKARKEQGVSEAYEPGWYRMMKALSDRRGSLRPGTSGDEQGGSPEPEDIAQLAAIEAVDVLGEIGGARAVDALIECLDDPDAPVRIHVLEALGEIGDRRPVPAIRTLAHEDPDPTVVIVAKDTLAKLDAP